MARLQALLVDLDGTLVDTTPANQAAYAQAVSQVLPDCDIDANALGACIAAGQSSREFLPALIPGLTPSQLDAVNAKKAACYGEHMESTALNESLVGFLLQNRPAVRIVLVTTAKRRNALTVLRHFGLAGAFDHSVFGEDVARMKPAPDAYLAALRATGLEAGQVLALEDSPVGQESAAAAGIAVLPIAAWSTH